MKVKIHRTLWGAGGEGELSFGLGEPEAGPVRPERQKAHCRPVDVSYLRAVWSLLHDHVRSHQREDKVQLREIPAGVQARGRSWGHHNITSDGQVSTPTAKDVLATGYNYECNSLYKQTMAINCYLLECCVSQSEITYGTPQHKYLVKKV